MAMSCCQSQFLQMKLNSETDDTISPIEDDVQKDNTEEDYSEEEWWSYGFLLEEHIENAQKKAKEEKEEAKANGYDSEDEDVVGGWSVLRPYTKSVRCLTIASLESYNRHTGTKYKLKRVVKATGYMCSGIGYVITFIAEEGSSDNEPDEPALEYLAWADEDVKVFYNSDDDKSSDKLFEGTVYWELDGKIFVHSCVIKTKDEVQKDDTEEDHDSEEEWWNGAFMQEEHAQIQKDNAEKKAKEEAEAEARVCNSEEDSYTRRGYVFDTDTKRIRCFAIASLESYNRQTGMKYKLKRVVEARGYMCTGLSYEIMFIAEEDNSDNEPDEPALEYLEWDDEGDEKVFYNSGDDKSSDKLFQGSVYWELSGKIEVESCVIKTKDEVKFKL